MPKLWNETIETHRDAVRRAVLDAAAQLIGDQGLAGVTMSAVAQSAEIGRTTLYRYFPDVESILVVWHERQIEAHLAELERAKDSTKGVREQLEAVLHAYAFLSRSGHGDCNVETAWPRKGGQAGDARRNLHAFLATMIQEGADAAVFRADVASNELAAFCLHALGASANLVSDEAVVRLVKVTWDALQPAQTSDA